MTVDKTGFLVLVLDHNDQRRTKITYGTRYLKRTLLGDYPHAPNSCKPGSRPRVNGASPHRNHNFYRCGRVNVGSSIIRHGLGAPFCYFKGLLWNCMFTRTGAFCFNSFTLFTPLHPFFLQYSTIWCSSSQPRSPRDLLTASSARIPNWISSHSFVYSSGRLISKPCGRHQEAPSKAPYCVSISHYTVSPHHWSTS